MEITVARLFFIVACLCVVAAGMASVPSDKVRNLLLLAIFFALGAIFWK